MKLMTNELMRKLPRLGSQEAKGLDALALVKFFTPDSYWTWYACEFDGEDLFYGLVAGHEPEFGYFSLTELCEVRGNLGLPVERDRYFQPTSLRELVKRENHVWLQTES